MKPIATSREGELEKRRYQDESQIGDIRTPFQHDKDRIIHSTAFRRLQYKTQVYVIHELLRSEMALPGEAAKGWLAGDPRMKAVYPVTPEIARQSVPIGAMAADGTIRYGEENTYRNSAFVIMEHKKTGLRWVKRLY